MPVNLAYLKALTPAGWDVDIIDETLEPALNEEGTNLTFGGADLVGITCMTHQAARSYQIAEVCRSKKIPVAMGGVHVTAYSHETLKYADTVGIREGYASWPKMIKDFEAGQLRQIYDGGLNNLGMLNGVIPDRDFLQKKYGYRYTATVASAGCPYHCEFCFVPLFQGRQYRERPVEDVLAELETFKGKYRGMIWTDENFYGHNRISHDRTLALYRGMAEREIKQNWFGFTSIHIAEDDEVLHWMAQSGSVGMLIGFESIDYDSLKQLNKRFNMKDSNEGYKRAIDNIRKHGLAIWATLLVGLDTDTPETYDRIADFVLENEIDIMTLGIESPSPGTPFWTRLMKEGRIFRTNFPHDWKYYNAHHLLNTLKLGSLDDLADGLKRMYDRLFTTEVLRKRFKNSVSSLGNMNAAMFAFKVNLDWQRVFRHIIHNLRELQDSGDYDRALHNVAAGRPAGPVPSGLVMGA